MTFETTISGYAYVVCFDWCEGSPYEVTVTRDIGGDVEWWDWPAADQQQLMDQCRDHEQTLRLEHTGD